MPQFQPRLAAPQLYNESHACAPLPGGELGQEKLCTAPQEGSPGPARGRGLCRAALPRAHGRPPAAAHPRRGWAERWQHFGLAFLRTAHPPTLSQTLSGAGGMPGSFGGSSSSTTSSWRGRSSLSSSAGRRESPAPGTAGARRPAGEQTKRGKEVPRRRKGPISRAPRPPAEPRPTPGTPRRVGGAPRGH